MKIFGVGVFLVAFLVLTGCRQGVKNVDKPDLAKTTLARNVKDPVFAIHPIQHATMVLKWKDITIYVDPVGGASAFSGYQVPDLILITDIHRDHFSLETLEELSTEKAKLMVPQAVADLLPEAFTPQIDVLDNGRSKERYGITVEAIPMYNLREEALQFHPNGRGNGYVLSMGDERLYISGDTEDIPEMRALKGITKAFVCMNLPYTMPVENAADAVLAFAPEEVFPYHYRGAEGFSDIQKFSKIVTDGNPKIKVTLLDWYN